MRKGDIIKFGTYPQEVEEPKKSIIEELKQIFYKQPPTPKKQPIKWLVLEANENEALLISLYGLAYKEYHYYSTDITWEDCALRKWLNNDFLKYAFSEEEIKRIKFSELKNEDNTEYRTRGGNNTKDRIFCLSFNEAEHYFGSDIDRQCKPTAYAVKQMGIFREIIVRDRHCGWMLRSPGIFHDWAANVDIYGSLNRIGNGVRMGLDVVRPALRIICNQ